VVAFLLVVGVLASVTLALSDVAKDGAAGDPWKEVQQAMKKGLPKTAIEKLEPIIAEAKKSKDWDEAIKAVGLKIALEGNIQGNKPEERIARMQQAINDSPAEMRPVMHAILAHWYWHYFQQNRWRIMQRTQTSQSPGDDVQSWSLERILDEIDEQLETALKSEEQLKKTPTKEFNELLVDGSMPDDYRPTMYDFLAHEALEFYTDGASYGFVAKAEDDYELPAGSPIFGTAQEFMKWQPEGRGDSWTLKAIRLYQDLLKFHNDDKDRTAFLAADLDRLHFGHNKAVGETKDARYQAALEKFAQDHREHELASRAYFLWASLLRSEDKLVAAHEKATQGQNLHPQSPFGKQCESLVAEIEAKQFQVTTERVWNEPPARIDVTYKNLSKLHFRIVAADWTGRATRQKRRPEGLDDADRKRLLNQKPAKSWSVDLPATRDYQQRSEEIDAPQDLNLKPGFYYLIASHAADFSDSDNRVQFTDFWVSELALVTRQEHGEAELGGLVTHAVSGAPIKGAKVQLWRQDRDGFVKGPDATTDADGLFHFDGLPQQSHAVQVTHGDQQLVSANDFYPYHYNRTPQPDEQTVFFTDRSLYRPGQTIHFKGIAFRVDQQHNNYNVLPGRGLTVIFSDANGEEIARQPQKTNDYGSFSGSFTAPRDRLMGRMTIRVDGEPSGAAQVSVEEYKRPKFQVKLDAPKDAPKLGAEVQLDGTATAYTGAPIDGAKVRWRVVRQVEFPLWWSWYRVWPPVSREEQEIAHGTATTDAEGRFEITFTSKPDPAVKEESEPVFTFAVTADVTDNTGETRSADRSLRIGYAAIQATLSANDWQTTDEPVKVTVKTQTLDGEPQDASGTVKVHRLDPPEKVHRKDLQPNYYRNQDNKPDPDLSDPKNWSLGEVVATEKFTTGADGQAELSFMLEAGAYQAVLESQDRFGKPVTARLVVTIIDIGTKKLSLKVPFLFAAPKSQVEPGETFTAVWGSGYDQARAYVEVEFRGKLLQAFWTDPDRTQVQIKQEITEEMRGGFTVRVTMVRENRAYIETHSVEVPWTNKQLTVKWERFVSKLKPGQQETWTAVITGPDGEEEQTEKAVAEMVATLYDGSLDAFLPHDWIENFNHVFRRNHSNLSSQFENQLKYLQHLHGDWKDRSVRVEITYDALPAEIVGLLYGYQWLRGQAPRGPAGFNYFRSEPEAAAASMLGSDKAEAQNAAGRGLALDAAPGEKRKQAALQDGRSGVDGEAGPDLGDVAARKNLSETAFFFPHLVSGQDGEVRIEFTMPEALTEWKFMGFAHDAKLRAGYLEDTAVTSKDLMIQPNPPRFVREGDVLEFTVKVTNRSAAARKGAVQLSFRDARTEDPRTAALGITGAEAVKSFDVPAGQSRSYSWKLTVPDGLEFLIYKAVGSTADEKLSDGEEGYLPVLPRRILVTESIQLPIRGPQTKTFDFEHLLNSDQSKTLEQQSLTVEMASNPAWYAVMALPYLMEYPYQCSEQVFNRLYANSLARHVANSDPKIERIFELWRGTDALDSPLLKNEDVKGVMIEETPWLQEAKNESEARRNVGILFEENRLNEELRRTMRQLTEMQHEDGAWPWFPGGPANDFITLYITTGFGRLRHLGVDVNVTPAVKSLARLDQWINRIYQEMRKGDKQDIDKNHLTPTIAFYLYGRSFFLEDQPIADEARDAVEYFRSQAKKHWLEVPFRMSQGHIALALHRFGDRETPQAIMKSIEERSVTDDELGMFWRELELSWWWYRAPIETQALMIEAFAEITQDQEAVDECQVWLLKQKQTQDWKTTKATADAVYSLLLRGGRDRLASDALVEITVGRTTVEPEQVEAGTGYFRERFVGPEVKPAMGHITVKKTDPGVAWGGVHWQYFEDLSKIPSYEGTPLKLQKSLWLREYTQDGPILKPLEGQAEVGDELVVRLEMRVDRDMEYVHLKDQRGSGTEPTDVLSQYKFRDGLAYYQSTRDTASHFFIDYLPKGVYVFEHSSYVVHRGQYQSGIATLECLYAPEFNAHSNSAVITVE
jgi:uncharacterized protein YfaS (alpha-2-macroglobulin family)